MLAETDSMISHLRAFVSGVMVSGELRADRDAVKVAVDALGPEYSAFAYQKLPKKGVPSDENPLALEESNYFILILARRFTPVILYEYIYAEKLGMPILILAQKREDRDPELVKFLFEQKRVVHEYNSLDQLRQIVHREVLAFTGHSREIVPVVSHVTDIWQRMATELCRNPDLIHTLKPRQFELFLADLLTMFQYEVEVTKSTRDGGFDIIAVRKGDPFFPSMYLVEAKLWTPPKNVGEPVIRSLYGAGIAKRCNGVMLVMTTGITQAALRYLEDHQLRTYVNVVDRTGLPDLYSRYLERKRGSCSTLSERKGTHD